MIYMTFMKTIGTGRESSLEDDDVVVVSLDVDWCEGMSTPRYLCMLRKDAVPYRIILKHIISCRSNIFFFLSKKQKTFSGRRGRRPLLFLRVQWNNRNCKSIVWRCIRRAESASTEQYCYDCMTNELTVQDIIV